MCRLKNDLKKDRATDGAMSVITPWLKEQQQQSKTIIYENTSTCSTCQSALTTMVYAIHVITRDNVTSIAEEQMRQQ